VITPLIAVVASFLPGSTPSKTVEVGDNFLAHPTQMRLSVRVRSGG
jgi:hypothetical protein